MKRIVLIILCSVLTASAGMAVAYYNTASIGYDNANIFEVYDGGVYIFDFDINYKKVKKQIGKLKDNLPDNFVSI